MIDESVELIGAFDAVEITYLYRAFDHCAIKLVRRSKLDARTALLRWTPALANADDDVTDARRTPDIAFYVLDRPDRLRLTAIQSWGDLESKFSGHFNRDALPEFPTPRGCLPGLFGGVAIVGLAVKMT